MTIEIRELPPRTQSLSAAEYASIFGGECGHEYAYCSKDEDRCEGMVCNYWDRSAPMSYCQHP
ncbi:MAG TPA: hypothetical protein PLA43_17605 [Bryobacteraceae bacterium]|nr:hypothetical protein [Bryobacteraceae bacterium]HOL70995.1 hypothetical protein [Bryobacteraceae bacterium]HPQ15230.1 hypothetical protein [Bryobacteraceae bacterium]HPU73770.1 hypothetical protein [Bryobacteraceae bacterium]